MQQFTLYWRDGKREVIEGNTVSEAFNLAGYGGNSAAALDFWAFGDDKNYIWIKERQQWMGSKCACCQNKCDKAV